MRGTPSCLLFDEQFVLLEDWFGHKGEDEIASIVERSLKGLEGLNGG